MSHLLVVLTPLSDLQVDTNCTESCIAWSSAHGHWRRLDKLLWTYPTLIFSAQVCLQQTTLDKATHRLYSNIQRPVRFHPALFLLLWGQSRAANQESDLRAPATFSGLVSPTLLFYRYDESQEHILLRKYIVHFFFACWHALQKQNVAITYFEQTTFDQALQLPMEDVSGRTSKARIHEQKNNSVGTIA